MFTIDDQEKTQSDLEKIIRKLSLNNQQRKAENLRVLCRKFEARKVRSNYNLPHLRVLSCLLKFADDPVAQGRLVKRSALIEKDDREIKGDQWGNNLEEEDVRDREDKEDSDWSSESQDIELQGRLNTSTPVDLQGRLNTSTLAVSNQAASGLVWGSTRIKIGGRKRGKSERGNLTPPEKPEPSEPWGAGPVSTGGLYEGLRGGPVLGLSGENELFLVQSCLRLIQGTLDESRYSVTRGVEGFEVRLLGPWGAGHFSSSLSSSLCDSSVSLTGSILSIQAICSEGRVPSQLADVASGVARQAIENARLSEEALTFFCRAGLRGPSKSGPTLLSLATSLRETSTLCRVVSRALRATNPSSLVAGWSELNRLSRFIFHTPQPLKTIEQLFTTATQALLDCGLEALRPANLPACLRPARGQLEESLTLRALSARLVPGPSPDWPPLVSAALAREARRPNLALRIEADLGVQPVDFAAFARGDAAVAAEPPKLNGLLARVLPSSNRAFPFESPPVVPPRLEKPFVSIFDEPVKTSSVTADVEAKLLTEFRALIDAQTPRGGLDALDSLAAQAMKIFLAPPDLNNPSTPQPSSTRSTPPVLVPRPAPTPQGRETASVFSSAPFELAPVPGSPLEALLSPTVLSRLNGFYRLQICLSRARESSRLVLSSNQSFLQIAKTASSPSTDLLPPLRPTNLQHFLPHASPALSRRGRGVSRTQILFPKRFQIERGRRPRLAPLPPRLRGGLGRRRGAGGPSVLPPSGEDLRTVGGGDLVHPGAREPGQRARAGRAPSRRPPRLQTPRGAEEATLRRESGRVGGTSERVEPERR